MREFLSHIHPQKAPGMVHRREENNFAQIEHTDPERIEEGDFVINIFYIGGWKVCEVGDEYPYYYDSNEELERPDDLEGFWAPPGS